MSLWHKTDHYDEVCTHVLIIGTSKYSYLPDNIPSSNEKLLRLTSLKTPAISAYRFACWIKDNYNNSEAPLGSIRLLLAPSEEEINAEPELAQLDQLPPNSSNVEDVLKEWKDDCLKFRAGHCIMYIAGHGIRLLGDSGIVLLEDFGNPHKDNVLKGAIDIGNIQRGMARNNAAKNQFYFVDACAIEPQFFAKYISVTPGVTLDNKSGEFVESSPIFFGAAPGTLALGKAGEGTLFIQVLLECLQRDAAKADDPNNPKKWFVSTLELSKQLQKGIKELAASYHTVQSVVLGGIISNTVFHELKKAPSVPVTVSLYPKEEEKYAKYKLINLTTHTLEDEAFPFESPKTKLVLPGIYSIEFHMTPESNYNDPQTSAIVVGSSSVKKEISL